MSPESSLFYVSYPDMPSRSMRYTRGSGLLPCKQKKLPVREFLEGGRQNVTETYFVSFVLSDGSGNTFIGYRVQKGQDDHEIHLQKVDPNGTVMWDESLPVDSERRASIIGMAGGEHGGARPGRAAPL